jgi:hypothetical protein
MRHVEACVFHEDWPSDGPERFQQFVAYENLGILSLKLVYWSVNGDDGNPEWRKNISRFGEFVFVAGKKTEL